MTGAEDRRGRFSSVDVSIHVGGAEAAAAVCRRLVDDRRGHPGHGPVGLRSRERTLGRSITSGLDCDPLQRRSDLRPCTTRIAGSGARHAIDCFDLVGDADPRSGNILRRVIAERATPLAGRRRHRPDAGGDRLRTVAESRRRPGPAARSGLIAMLLQRRYGSSKPKPSKILLSAASINCASASS